MHATRADGTRTLAHRAEQPGRTGTYATSLLPWTPGGPVDPCHEGVGIVQRTGRGVTRVREGDRVAIPWLGWACGECEYCLTGWETLCERQQNSGYSVDGG
jgi:alcohol dehydrogenase, propanol-preferring